MLELNPIWINRHPALDDRPRKPFEVAKSAGTIDVQDVDLLFLEQMPGRDAAISDVSSLPLNGARRL